MSLFRLIGITVNLAQSNVKHAFKIHRTVIIYTTTVLVVSLVENMFLTGCNRSLYQFNLLENIFNQSVRYKQLYMYTVWYG